MKKHRLVEVDWVDAALTSGWRNPPRATLSRCKTAGYLIQKDKQVVVIAMQVADTGSAGEMMAIPRSNVKGIRNL